MSVRSNANEALSDLAKQQQRLARAYGVLLEKGALRWPLFLVMGFAGQGAVSADLPP